MKIDTVCSIQKADIDRELKKMRHIIQLQGKNKVNPEKCEMYMCEHNHSHIQRD